MDAVGGGAALGNRGGCAAVTRLCEKLFEIRASNRGKYGAGE